MTALVGTVTIPGKAGERGQQYKALGKYTLLAALANADTITWPNFFPKVGTATVVGFEIWGVELDTNASPTATFIVGDGTDTDGYLTTKGAGVGLQNSLAGQLFYKGDGAIIGTATNVGRDLVLTVNAAVATGATSGDIFVSALLEGV